MSTKQYRQGDILISYIPESDVPKDARPVAPINGRMVLAEGEATGHAHTIDADYGTMVEKDGVLYLRLTADAPLMHQEHGQVTIERIPGMVPIRERQREYSPEAIRNVAD